MLQEMTDECSMDLLQGQDGPSGDPEEDHTEEFLDDDDEYIDDSDEDEDDFGDGDEDEDESC